MDIKKMNVLVKRQERKQTKTERVGFSGEIRMSIEQEKMLLDRLHTKILKNKIAEIVTRDELNALVNAKYRITKVKPKFNENIGVYYCPDCERHLAVNYDLHCSGCGLPIDYSDFASCNLNENLVR